MVQENEERIEAENIYVDFLNEMEQGLTIKSEFWREDDSDDEDSHNKYWKVLSLAYFKSLELSTTNRQDLTELFDRYEHYKADFDVRGLIFENSFLLFALDGGTRYDNNTKSTNITNNFSKFLIKTGVRQSYFDRQNFHYEKWQYNRGSSLEFAIPIIADPHCFSSIEKIDFCWDFSKMERKDSIINRIYMAVLLDNPVVLKLFLEEYENYSKGKKQTINKLIIDHALMGLAAANGCLQVVNLFIEMGVDLEIQYSIQVELGHQCDYKSLLSNYENNAGDSLEMTALSLALSAARAMDNEKAYNLIEALVAAGARYDNKIIKKWRSFSGYHGQMARDNVTRISLFEFDQSGILQKVVDKKRNNRKSKPSYSNRNDENDNDEIYQLRREVADVKQENVQLRREIDKLWKVVRQLQKRGDREDDEDKTYMRPKGNNFFSKN